MNEKDMTGLTKLVNMNEISRAYGLTKSGIFNLIKQGKFPAGVKLGGSRRWNPDEVESWMKKQVKQIKEVEAASC